jgi:alkaline phosphatase D
MNGYSEMREAVVWVQTTDPCIVELVYWVDSLPENEFHATPVATKPADALTAYLVADSVEPGTRYGYAIYANGKNQTTERELYFSTQPLWQYRKEPPAFTIALGSCTYINEPKYDRPGEGYGGTYRIFETLAEENADMMLWLGDNIYLREVDWFSTTGIQKRYSHTRKLPEMQELLTTGQHYAIWDDHDYGPNNANRAFPHKDKTLKAFKNFWANNGYGVNKLGGITSAFQFVDVDFFLLDNRWNRTGLDMATVEEQMLGQDQIDWLIELLKFSRAPFKFVAVGGQVLNSVKAYETYARFEKEREELLNRIAAENIAGVIFLTGDRHHTELSKLEVDGTVMYDLTVSPLTSSPHNPDSENNTNRVEDTMVNERNYGLINVSGPFGERKLSIEIKNVDGELIWDRDIEQTPDN